MGILDMITGTKRPKEGTPTKSATELRAALLGLNRDTAPWHVRDAEAADECDLIVEWKIVDAQWHSVFGKAKVESVFKIYLKLDTAANEVRALDREWTVAWNGGIPILTQAGGFRGQMNETSYNIGWGFTEEGKFGTVKYRFSTGEMKKPVKDIVTAAGWTYKAVVFGKL